jgi:hypothetical protein
MTHTSTNRSLVRNRREHRVFTALLQMVPGLEDRLTDGGGSDVVAIAEMVRLIIICIVMDDCVYCYGSYKKVHLALGLMTQKV